MVVYRSFEELAAAMEFGERAEFHLCSQQKKETETFAFAENDTVALRVAVPRCCAVTAATLCLYRDDDLSDRRLPMEWAEFRDAADVFAISLILKDYCLHEGGLFYFTVALETPLGELYVNRDGRLTPDRGGVERVQLTVYTANFVTPARFAGGMMYQIFPDRFARGQAVGNTENEIDKLDSCGRKINSDWEHGIPQYAEIPGGEVANDEFFGGNLWGIAEKLDTIQSLGVNILYLCPIFEAASNHRYDTGDYTKIDALLGGEDAFRYLISELKKRGMLLILDGVFNHTGADSLYFDRFGHYGGQGAYASKTSPFFNWYTFMHYPDSYRCWWGVKILPEVKTDEASYHAFICGPNGIARKYLRDGVDGWRLDVADELSDTFLNDFRSACKAENPEALILGEVWEDASNKVAYDRRRRYFRGGQLDSVMNYPLRSGVIDFIRTADATKLSDAVRTITRHYPEQVSSVLMNFLGTHDTERIITLLADVGSERMTNTVLASYQLPAAQRQTARDRVKLAWALLAAFPGIPCIYYGDEIGMEGGRDPFNRRPYGSGVTDPDLLAFYKRVGMVRAKHSALSTGRLTLCEAGDRSRFLMARYLESETVYIAVNLAANDWTLEFETPAKRLLSDGETSLVMRVSPRTIEYFALSTTIIPDESL